MTKELRGRAREARAARETREFVTYYVTKSARGRARETREFVTYYVTKEVRGRARETREFVT